MLSHSQPLLEQLLFCYLTIQLTFFRLLIAAAVVSSFAQLFRPSTYEYFSEAVYFQPHAGLQFAHQFVFYTSQFSPPVKTFSFAFAQMLNYCSIFFRFFEGSSKCLYSNSFPFPHHCSLTIWPHLLHLWWLAISVMFVL